MFILNNSNIKVKTLDDKWSYFEGIRKIAVDKYLKFTFDDNTILECTDEHKIYINEDIPVWAELLGEGEKVYSNGSYKTIISIEEINEKKEVYDLLDVYEDNRFYCNDILVSNCEDFWTSNYPALSSSKNSRVIIISTPNGMFNLFHQLYEEARDVDEMKEYKKALKKGGKALEKIKEKHGHKNAFIRAKFDWRVVPGRDDKWADVERSNIGDVKFSQEFECNFLGSTYTLIEPQTLQRLLLETSKDPELIDLAGRLRVYEQPLENTSYIIGVDPAKGTGQHDSVIQILKVISIDPSIQLEQVAVFQNNKTDTYSFARILNRLSIFYNNALIIIENNGEGSAVVHHLWWTLENQNMYCENQTATGLGLRATQRTKTKAVLLMKKFLEEKKLLLRDKETARQLATFIEKDNGAFAGQDGVPDDLVSGLYWGCYALELDIFDDQAKIIDMENNDDDVWGILSDVDDFNDDMSWL